MLGIGEKLKDARENMGISSAEVAEDLHVDVAQIDAIENGNMDSFKDVFSLNS